jgi:hypothetical protein
MAADTNGWPLLGSPLSTSVSLKRKWQAGRDHELESVHDLEVQVRARWQLPNCRIPPAAGRESGLQANIGPVAATGSLAKIDCVGLAPGMQAVGRYAGTEAVHRRPVADDGRPHDTWLGVYRAHSEIERQADDQRDEADTRDS